MTKARAIVTNTERFLPWILGTLLFMLLSGTVVAAPPADKGSAASLPQTVAPAQENNGRNMDLVSQVGGAVQAVDTDGSYAYLGIGPHLVIWNITDPQAPVQVAKSETLARVANDLQVVGNYVYLADTVGLRIIDVSNPSDPRERGFAATTFEPNALDVFRHGPSWYAYVTAGSYIQIIDVTNPDRPQRVNTKNLGGFFYAQGIDVYGDHAYVANESDGLQILSIADPLDPQVISRYAEVDNARDVVITGTHAFVADVAGLHIVDVADPENPSRTGTQRTPGVATAVAITPQYAYLADGAQGLYVVDINNLSNPERAGQYENVLGYATGVAARDNHAYLLTENVLYTLDVETPSTPALAHQYNALLPSAYAVDVAGDRAYVASGESGLQILDTSNVETPLPLGQTKEIGDASAVDIAGTYAYVASAFSGLYVVDVSNPNQPNPVGHWDTPQNAESLDVVVRNNLAYMAEQPDWDTEDFLGGGLRIIDVTEPENPHEVGYIDTRDEGMAVALAGDYAYLAVSYYSTERGEQIGGLSIIDIYNPSTPAEVAFLEFPTTASGVAVAWPYAYVTTARGLRIIDVRNPAAPTEIGFLTLPAFSVTVSGHYAYVASTNVTMIDISDPRHPTQHGHYNTPGRANWVAIRGDYAYVADVAGGLSILEPVKAERLYLPLAGRNFG
jgi:hypothetical protein